MNMKKWMSALLATTLAASMALTGCGGGSGETKAPAGDAPANTEAPAGDATEAPAGDATEAPAGDDVQAADKIVIFQSKVEIIDQLEAAAELYYEETGVEVEVQGTTGDDYFQQLKTKLANNQGPTIFNQGGGTELEQIAPYTADLSDLEWISSLPEGATAQVDGQVRGIPYTMEGFGMVYNKDLIDATALKSTDDFVNMMTEQKANDVVGFELSSEAYFLIGHILCWPFGLQADPEKFVEDLAAGTVKMADTPEFQEWAEMMVAIRENGNNPVEQNYDGECGDLATGKAASIHQGNWAITMFADYGEVNLGLAPMPIGGNDKLIAMVPTYWSVNSSATPEEQKAAKDFLTWLYTTESGKNILYNEFKFVPLMEGDVSENLDVLSADLQKYIAEGKTIPNVSSLWPAGIVDVFLVPVAQEFFTTDMSAEDFLAALDATWAEAVANQNK